MVIFVQSSEERIEVGRGGHPCVLEVWVGRKKKALSMNGGV